MPEKISVFLILQPFKEKDGRKSGMIICQICRKAIGLKVNGNT